MTINIAVKTEVIQEGEVEIPDDITDIYDYALKIAKLNLSLGTLKLRRSNPTTTELLAYDQHNESEWTDINKI